MKFKFPSGKKALIIYILGFLVVISLISSIIDSISDAINGVSSAEFKNVESEVLPGDVLDLEYRIKPFTAKYESIKFTFDKPDLVTKDGDNYIAFRDGELSVTIYIDDVKYGSKKFNISPVSVTSISLNSFDLSINDSIEVEPIFEPNNASHRDFTITTDDLNIISINNNVVKGVSEGDAKIKITSSDGPTCYAIIHVKAVPVKSIKLNASNTKLVIGNDYKVNVDFEPTNATYKDLLYQSSDNNVAVVDNEGNIYLKNPGNFILTAIYNDEISDSADFVVEYGDPISISVDNAVESIEVGSTKKLSITFSPSKVKDDSLSWISSDDSILFVDDNGNIKGLKEGKATITIIAINGIKTTIDISVVAKKVNQPNNSNINSTSGGTTSSGGSVYVTKSGKKYHSHPGCSNMKSPIEISEADAIAKGYTPCSKCW